MLNRTQITTLLLAGFISHAALAQQAAPKPSQQPPKMEPVPDAPPQVRQGSNADDNAEPTVVIRQEGDNKIEEFSINGRHYATRVTPKNGVPYVLIDPDGNGRMTPTDDMPARLRPPQWTLFKF